MRYTRFFFVLILFIFSTSEVGAQDAWKTKLGTWINVEVKEKLENKLSFDSTAHLSPRMLWIYNLQEIEIEYRFEQKKKYVVKKAGDNCIDIDLAKLCTKGDTLIMERSNARLTKFVKYK